MHFLQKQNYLDKNEIKRNSDKKIRKEKENEVYPTKKI